MFKKLTILVLISLLVLTAATACSSKATGEISPPAATNTEQKPTAPATTPATTPKVTPETPDKTTPAPTTPEGNPGPVAEEDPERVIPVSEFIKGVIDGKYQPGDIVTISGILLNEPERGLSTYGYYYEVLLGPETSNRVASVSTGQSQRSSEATRSFESFYKFIDDKEMRPKPGDEMVIRGEIGRMPLYYEGKVTLGNAFLLEVRK
jgi:hypothetical protein